MVKIYHNSRCSKSRETLNLLHAHGFDPEVVHYLDTPLSLAELKVVLDYLGISAFDLIRTNEDEFKKFKGKDLTEIEWIQVMLDYPKLMERPIVVKGNKAVIGRPPEKVLEILLTTK